MTRTGGFAGESLMVAVDQYGSYMVSRGRGEPPAVGGMDHQDFDELTDALAAAHLDSQRSVYSRHCADQFHYTFSYGDAYYATDDCPVEPEIVSKLTGGPLSGLIELSTTVPGREEPLAPSPSTGADARKASSTSVSVDPPSARSGNGPTVTATVMQVGGTPVGTVTLEVGSRTRTLDLHEGYADWTLPILTIGSRRVTATYHGSTSTAPSTSAPVTLKTTQIASHVYGLAQVNRDAGRLTLRITVSTAKGISPAGHVTVTTIGQTKATVTVKVNANGSALVKIKNFKPGRYLIKMRYPGNGTVAASRGSLTFF